MLVMKKTRLKQQMRLSLKAICTDVLLRAVDTIHFITTPDALRFDTEVLRQSILVLVSRCCLRVM